MKRNALELSMMFNLSPIFIWWSAPLSFKIDGLTVSLGRCILWTFIQMQLCDGVCRVSWPCFQGVNLRWHMMLFLKCNVVSNCCWSSLDHGMFLNNIAPSWSEHVRSSIHNQVAFVITRIDFDGLRQLILWFFLCPQFV